jgi:predicted nucleotidyltransferase
MERDEILRLLRERQPQMRALGVKSLALFGSVAREESTPASDIDVLVEFESPATFDAYMETRFFLEDLLGLQVDLVTPQALRPRMRPNVERDLIYVTR